MALSDSRSVQDVQGLISAATVVNAYVRIVSKLDDNTSLPNYKTINQHVKAAKANAQYWQTELFPVYKETTSGILKSSEFFCDTIHGLQESLKTAAKKNFQLELNKLIKVADSQESTIAEVIVKINKFSEDEAKILSDFHSDTDRARIEMIGDQANLHELQKELHSIEQAIIRDKALFAGAVLSIFFVVGAAIALKIDEDAKSRVESEIRAKKLELSNITAFKAQYDQLNLAGESLSQALSQMQQGWNSLKADIQEVIDILNTLSSTEAVDYLQPLLDTAYSDWMNVVEVAKKL